MFTDMSTSWCMVWTQTVECGMFENQDVNNFFYFLFQKVPKQKFFLGEI